MRQTRPATSLFEKGRRLVVEWMTPMTNTASVASWISIGAAALLVLATGANAEAFCKALLDLGNGLNEPFQSADQSFALPDHRSSQAGCQTSLNMEGGRSLHCMWVFPHRADAAAQAFETLLTEVGACGAASAVQDQKVNHPDFYDLRLFDFAADRVGVSLKDKGALSQTLVFLTFTKVAKT
jgi:hypothetical protein